MKEEGCDGEKGGGREEDSCTYYEGGGLLWFQGWGNGRGVVGG